MYNKEAEVGTRNDIPDLEYRLEMHYFKDSVDKEKYHHVLEMTGIVLKEQCGEKRHDRDTSVDTRNGRPDLVDRLQRHYVHHSTDQGSQEAMLCWN